MKKLLFTTLVLALLLGLTTIVVGAAPPAQAQDIVFKSISLAPENPYPGQEVVITLTYTSATTVTQGTVVTHPLTIEGPEGIIEKRSGEIELTFGSGKAKGAFFAPPDEGTFTIKIPVEDDSEEVLSEIVVVETALPPAVAQLFAGLGLFAAVMAVMAVGTEVVIESFKFVLGLKQKVTAFEAFDELKRELPGALTGLGVDPELRSNFDKLLTDTKTTLQPVGDTTEAVAAIRNAGSFEEAYDALKALEAAADPLKKQIDDKKVALRKLTNADDKKKAEEALRTLTEKIEGELDDLKNVVVSAIKTGFEALRKTSLFSDTLIEKIEEQITQEIQRLKIDDVVEFTDTTLKSLQALNPELAADWLRSQVNTYLKNGRKGAEQGLDEVVNALQGLGFEDAGAVRSQLSAGLDKLETQAHNKAYTYTFAVQELLTAVEERRNEVQSPFRKLYRRLRDSDGVMLPAILLFLIFSIGGIALALVLPASWKAWIVVIELLVGIGISWVINQALLKKEKKPGQSGKTYWKLGASLRSIEKILNRFRGDTQDPEKYGQVDEKVMQLIKNTGPASIAGLLLKLENKHQDQETSRIRTLRIMSIIVGVLLAYYLRIDAAAYLNYAVPGVSEKINAVPLQSLGSFVPEKLTVGIILTGLAASAGSKFWRDLLGRLTTARGQAEEAARLVRKVQGTVGIEK